MARLTARDRKAKRPSPQVSAAAKTSSQGAHASQVDAWLNKTAKALPPEALLRLFEAGLNALWTRTETTLGTVTLSAIAVRVLYDASSKFPSFSAITVEPTQGILYLELRDKISSVLESELRGGIRFVLVEFLTVLGNLTADLLTAELHLELARVAPPKPLGAKKKRSPPKSAAPEHKDKG